MTAAERQAAAEAEIAKLQVWQRNDDSESYRNILKDLTYSEKEVRYAAMDALKQVDNTNAIPTLRELAAKTDDLDEAKALLDTAQFISLPPADLVGLGAKRSKSSSGAGANH
jgi:HEAT repeat protein